MDAAGEAPPAAAPPADEDGFEAILDATIEHEGGWVLSRDSNGAAVFAGVNRKANPSWPGWSHLPDHPPARKRRIETPELKRLVGAVYREQYWASRICEFCDAWPTLRKQVFDCTVNHGIAGAAWRLQEACRLHGATIEADGKMGPATERAIRALVAQLGERGANDAVVDARVAFYERIGTGGKRRFVKGWVKRAESYRLSKAH